MYLFRNFRQNGEGTVEEINFEEFLVVMSHFRPPSLNMTEEQRESVRREKLRCVSHRKSHDHMLDIIYGWHTAVKLTLLLSAVLFNMHDTNNDGTITLEEYRHVSCCSPLQTKNAPSFYNWWRLQLSLLTIWANHDWVLNTSQNSQVGGLAFISLSASFDHSQHFESDLKLIFCIEEESAAFLKHI